MSFTNIPTRTSADINSASDINQLNENIQVLKGGLTDEVPEKSMAELLTYINEVIDSRVVWQIIQNHIILPYSYAYSTVRASATVIDALTTSITTKRDNNKIMFSKCVFGFKISITRMDRRRNG